MERNTEAIRPCDRCGKECKTSGFVTPFCLNCMLILNEENQRHNSSPDFSKLLVSQPEEAYITPREHLAAQGRIVKLQDELLEDYKVFRETGAWPIRKSDQPGDAPALTGLSEDAWKEMLAAIDRTLDEAEAISTDRGSAGPGGAVIVGNDFDSLHLVPKPDMDKESIGFEWLKMVWTQANGIEHKESTPEEISEMLIDLGFKRSAEDSLVYKKEGFPYFVEFEGVHYAVYDERHGKWEQPDIGEACFTSAVALAKKITQLYLRLFNEK